MYAMATGRWITPSNAMLGREHEEGLSALSGVGPAAAQQTPKRRVRSEAARRLRTRGPAERCLGDGFCSRPTSDGPQVAHPDCGLYALAYLTGFESPVQRRQHQNRRRAPHCQAGMNKWGKFAEALAPDFCAREGRGDSARPIDPAAHRAAPKSDRQQPGRRASAGAGTR